MKHQVILLTLVYLVLASCQNESAVEPKTPKKGDNFTFFESKNIYGEALGQRSSEYSAPFEITKVERLSGPDGSDHSLMIVTTEHDGSCSGDFELIWTGAIMESYPPQTHIAVRYNASCTGSAQPVQTVLSMDLDEFIGDREIVDIAIFHIINSSKITTDGDVASEPVSSN